MLDDTALPENWRPVVGYEGAYEVSDLGRVRSLDRFITFAHPTKLGLRRRGRRLKPGPGSHGYPTVGLSSSDHRRVTYLVHRLVLAAFAGPCPDGMEGCHGNGVRSDARLSNLRWDTPSENSHDTVRHGRNQLALRRTCPLGHRLTAPNLRPGDVAMGHRGCLACSRAAAHVCRQRKRGVVVDKKAFADREFQKIMAGVPAYANGRGRRASV